MLNQPKKNAVERYWPHIESYEYEELIMQILKTRVLHGSSSLAEVKYLNLQIPQ